MKPVDIGDFGCSALPAMGRCEAVLPDTPDCAPNYHFGMLLGVEDFRAEQGFHIGRLRRHQRLLHGSGVVAGYDVTPEDGFEIRVGPGYAIDALGRDLILDVAQCVSLTRWWLVHRDDDAFDDIANKDDATVNLDVVACYACCLGAPVPAIAEPCAGDAADIAYSRVCEIVKLKLVRTPDPLPPPPPPVAGAALEHEALAQAVAKKSPGLPEGDSDDEKFCLTLARLHDVHLQLVPGGSSGWTASIGTIDLGVRDSLLPTSMLQALLLGDPPPAAAGPVVIGTPNVAGTQVTLVFSQKLAPTSITAAAFAVSEFIEAQGWKPFTLGTPSYDETDPAKPAVQLPLDRAPDATAKLIRITVIGSGNAPLLGANLIPAGAVRPSDEGRALTTSIHGS